MVSLVQVSKYITRERDPKAGGDPIQLHRMDGSMRMGTHAAVIPCLLLS